MVAEQQAASKLKVSTHPSGSMWRDSGLTVERRESSAGRGCKHPLPCSYSHLLVTKAVLLVLTKQFQMSTHCQVPSLGVL